MDQSNSRHVASLTYQRYDGVISLLLLFLLLLFIKYIFGSEILRTRDLSWVTYMGHTSQISSRVSNIKLPSGPFVFFVCKSNSLCCQLIRTYSSCKLKNKIMNKIKGSRLLNNASKQEVDCTLLSSLILVPNLRAQRIACLLGLQALSTS